MLGFSSEKRWREQAAIRWHGPDPRRHLVITDACLCCAVPPTGRANMTTPLDKPIRRELLLQEKPYTLTIDPEGMKLVEKGRRIGLSLAWTDLVSGDAALAAALRASSAQGAR